MKARFHHGVEDVLDGVKDLDEEVEGEEELLGGLCGILGLQEESVHEICRKDVWK